MKYISYRTVLENFEILMIFIDEEL